MPELNQGATVFEIKEAYEAEKSKLLTETFSYATLGARGVELPLSPEARKGLNPRELRSVDENQAEIYVRNLREERKVKYLELDAEMREAINLRAKIIESELLSPKEVNPTDLIAAAQMNEDALNSAIEIALDLDEPAEDTLLLLLKVARENDVDSAIARVMTVREDIADLMGELAEAQQTPELEADLAWETFAADLPSGREILGARQSDLNIAHQL